MTEKGCYRYYSTQRPLSLGTFPKPQGNKVLAIENFDERTYCEEIDREAWGYIEYELPVSEVLLKDFEMVKAGVTEGARTKHQYSWSVDDHNTMTVWEDNTVLATLEDCYSECEDCFDCTLERLFKEVVYELRGVDLDEA